MDVSKFLSLTAPSFDSSTDMGGETERGIATQQSAPWYPSAGDVCVVSVTDGQPDQYAYLLHLAIADLDTHVVKMSIVSTRTTIGPILLPKNRYRFAEGTDAMVAMGLRQEVARILEQQRSEQQRSLDA